MSESPHAQIYVIEGNDGTGKSTLIAEGVKHLESQGKKVATFRLPGGTKVNEAIRAVTKMDEAKDISDLSMTLLMASTLINITDEIRKIRNTVDVIILDRWYYTTYVYQGKGEYKCEVKAILEELTNNGHILMPDKKVLLTAPYELYCERMGNRKDQARDHLDPSNREVYESRQERYLSLVRWQWVIDAVDHPFTPEEVAKRIWGDV